MALSYDNKIDEWQNEGTEPSSDLKENGFTAGYKPPASVFNWFWNKVTKCISELQTKLNTVNTSLSNYLPLSGGTVDGTITAAGGLNFNDDYKISIVDDEESEYNGYLQVRLNDGLVVDNDIIFSGAGTVMLYRDPIKDMEAATKQYVDKLKTKIYIKADDTDDYGTFNTADGEVYESLSDAWSNAYSGCEIILLPGTHIYKTTSYFNMQMDDVVIRGIDVCYRNTTILDIQTASTEEAFLIYGDNIHVSDLTLTCSTQSSLAYFGEIAGIKDEIIFNNVYFEYPSKICIEILFVSSGTWKIPLVIQNCCFKSLSDSFTATVYFSNTFETTFVFPIILRNNIEIGNEFSYVERSTSYPATVVSYENHSIDSE